MAHVQISPPTPLTQTRAGLPGSDLQFPTSSRLSLAQPFTLGHKPLCWGDPPNSISGKDSSLRSSTAGIITQRPPHQPRAEDHACTRALGPETARWGGGCWIPTITQGAPFHPATQYGLSEPGWQDRRHPDPGPGSQETKFRHPVHWRLQSLGTIQGRSGWRRPPSRSSQEQDGIEVPWLPARRFCALEGHAGT